jgi:chromosomal replication initiation ATPase DnaA
MKPSILEIEKIVCKGEEVLSQDLHNGRRFARFNTPRQIIMFFALEYGYTQFKAGQYFFRDHATVINARQSINNFCDTDTKFRAKIDNYRKKIEHEMLIVEKHEGLTFAHFMIPRMKLIGYQNQIL